MLICQRWSMPLLSFSAEHCRRRVVQARFKSTQLKSYILRMLWGIV